MEVYWLLIFAVFINVLTLILVYVNQRGRREYLRKIKKLHNEVHDLFTDYVCPQKMLLIRVFPVGYETEALEGITHNNVLEYGQMGKWMYYLIQLK